MNKYYKRYSLLGLVCLIYSIAQAVETPEERFLQAAYQNDLATVKKSIEQEHVDVNVKRSAGFAAVWEIQRNGYHCMKRKLKFHGSCVETGLTALEYAVQAGSTAVVKYLLAVPGIDIECISDDTDSHSSMNCPNVLYKALDYNEFASAYELIKAGANYKITNFLGMTVRERAFKNGSSQALSIVQFIDNIEQLYAALKANNEQQVKLLLQKVPYTIKDQEGNTLLHRAVRSCSPELVGLILKLDPQAITQQNKQGQTPVDIAAQHPRYDLVELFTKLAHAEPEPVNYSEDPCTTPFCTIV